MLLSEDQVIHTGVLITGVCVGISVTFSPLKTDNNFSRKY